MDEMQKTAKSTFRPRAKCKNRQNLRFAHGRNTKNAKNYVSPTDEMQKTAKSMFPPRRKNGKRQNLRFRHGGSIFFQSFFIFYHVPPHVLGPFRGVGAIMCFRGGMLNPNRSNDRLGLKRDKSRSYAC